MLIFVFNNRLKQQLLNEVQLPATSMKVVIGDKRNKH